MSSDDPASDDPAGGDLGKSVFDAARKAARRGAYAKGNPSSPRRSADPDADADPAVAPGVEPPRRRRGGYSGSGPDERDPQAVREVLRRLVTEHGWQSQVTAASVMGRWVELVGADVAQRCRPESLQRGELVIAADSTAWATQLRLLAPKLLVRFSSELGPGVVTRIRVHGPAGPSWHRGPLRVTGRGPRDTYG